MADEKRASDKMYTHSASRKARGEGTREERKVGKETATATETGDDKKVAETLEEIRARHRREQEDGHKSHTDAMDAMFSRHADELDAAIAKHGTNLESGPGVTAKEA